MGVYGISIIMQLLRSQPRRHLTLCVATEVCGLAHLPAAVDPGNRPSSAADWQVARPTCSRSVAQICRDIPNAAPNIFLRDKDGKLPHCRMP